ncbi:uncharacterized protein [Haliotis asinina]|uniref:uncharacterized protein n=1 Tax=Haliotis asinina TaxID=109174 RepID=UPI003531FBA3
MTHSPTPSLFHTSDHPTPVSLAQPTSVTTTLPSPDPSHDPDLSHLQSPLLPSPLRIPSFPSMLDAIVSTPPSPARPDPDSLTPISHTSKSTPASSGRSDPVSDLAVLSETPASSSRPGQATHSLTQARQVPSLSDLATDAFLFSPTPKTSTHASGSSTHTTAILTTPIMSAGVSPLTVTTTQTSVSTVVTSRPPHPTSMPTDIGACRLDQALLQDDAADLGRHLMETTPPPEEDHVRRLVGRPTRLRRVPDRLNL